VITIGKTGTASRTVTEKLTAKYVGSGSLDVFATPMMIALMEAAACECIVSELTDGSTSVGTQINVAHVAASPLGADIIATATVTAVDGRKVSFNVTAHDGVCEIGNGTHERFIVDIDKFMKKLEQR